MVQELYKLPDGWEWRNLGELCDFVRGPFGGSLKKEIFKPDGYAVYEQQHAINNQFVEIRYFIDESKFAEMQRFILNPGDLIMSCSGTMGKTAIVPENIKLGIINQALLKITTGKELSNKYLQLWMDSPHFQRIVADNSQGAAIKNMASVKVLKLLMIPLPSIVEQQRQVQKIIVLLNHIDTAIEHLTHSLELNDQLFASSLNQAFNPLDAETQADGTYQLPEGWEWKYLSNACDMEKNTILPDAKKQYFYVGMEHIESNTGKIDADEVTQGASILSTKVQFSENDVLYGKLRPYLNKVGIATKEGIASTEIIPLTCTSEISAQYLSSFLRTPFFVSWAVNNCSGARMPRVTTKFVKQIARVPLCSKEQQAEISDFLENLSHKIQANKQALQQKLEQLQQLKASLLNSVFRGEL